MSELNLKPITDPPDISPTLAVVVSASCSSKLEGSTSPGMVIFLVDLAGFYTRNETDDGWVDGSGNPVTL